MATLLPAQAQFVLFWGAAYTALYNDAYAPTIGNKHPQALGRPGEENWRELWDDLEPLLRNVRETGQTFSAKDRPFYIERRGLGETVYFDVSYSAVREADGSVGGVLCLVTETTERVRFQQRQAFLLELNRTLPGLGEAERIEAYVVSRLAEQLGAAQVCFGEDQATANVSRSPRTGLMACHRWSVSTAMQHTARRCASSWQPARWCSRPMKAQQRLWAVCAPACMSRSCAAVAWRRCSACIFAIRVTASKTNASWWKTLPSKLGQR